MTFDDVYESVAVGAVVSVSNGAPKPPERARLRYACWRSHNFSGALLEKLAPPDQAARALVIEAANEPGLKLAYTIVEGAGHTFDLTERAS